MPRPTKTPAQRAADIAAATSALTSATVALSTALSTYGPSDARTIAAAETVEQHGAIVHRQSRLLAGKSKGG